MPTFRYVAVSPDRREQHRAIGKAHALHDFLVDHQTDADGRVWYGKVISYAWIRSKWLTAPSERTLERHMARLKACGLVHVRSLPKQYGMRVTVLRSAKWPQPQAQIPLFPAAEILSITRGIAAGKQRNSSGKVARNGTAGADRSGGTLPTEVAAKEVKNRREEKTNSNPANLADARSAPAADEAALAARRQLLRDQAAMLATKFKSSG